ncbi:hypothetical protein HYH03_007490 [Edaphochlamys debaryana]|uniref:Uncharacterized protein n=1 Tax=Edaphochlamys debaryana TaxID=47281 RepID=A0A835Y491_9CHLO|nr:hypothetical protein HYH03_007490 [Edaphochlamys debaryana]|eukprot:KAG2494438.1 hypothetical protein HYH03_007490 [Edaphochlamys debaryana]
MPLNPFAREFIPTGQAAPVMGKADVAEVEAPTFNLVGLPEEVVASVVSFLTAPADLASCVISCQTLKKVVRDAEVCLDGRMLGRIEGLSTGSTEELAAYRQQALRGMGKYLTNTVALLLPNVALEDSDVRDLLAALPRLQLVDLSGGRKLTHATAAALATANQPVSPAAPPSPDDGATAPAAIAPAAGPLGLGRSSGEGEGSRVLPLRAAFVQRCFQLHSGSMDGLMAAPGLACLAMSHLDLGRWPADAPAASDAAQARAQAGDVGRVEAAGAQQGPGLEVLALHNCMRLHGQALAALAAGERRGARFLLLGGCTLSLSSFVGEAAAPSLPPDVARRVAALFTPARTSSPATCAAQLGAARHLVAAALAMPRLVALELTFFPPPVVQCVRAVLAEAAREGAPAVEVWDFAQEPEEVEAARRTLARHLPRSVTPGPRVQSLGGAGGAQQLRSSGGAGPGVGAGAGAGSRRGDVLTEQMVSSVLRCAANCSSVTRSTPLHGAAERGNEAGVAALLAAGASLDARDTAGSTPLFLACFTGRVGVVQRLLAAGADPQLSNAAGETPLYIASLRGHLGCVQALLERCTAAGIAWQDVSLYGDAWTPLHAAAVANRADVAACLLQAAGASRAGELVMQANKYGQSVLHIAARKGTAELLTMLLRAGPKGVAAGARDANGDTPVDIAVKNRHAAALAEFKRMGHAAPACPARQQAAGTSAA